MYDEGKWERCEPDDPNRCQSSIKNMQCPYKAKPGAIYCPRHNAAIDNIKIKQNANKFRLAQYQTRVDEFQSSNEIFNIREELAILRMVLEEVIVACGGDQNKLIQYSGKIADLLVKIKDMVKSCQTMEQKLGKLLEVDKLIVIAQNIVQIISDHVTDPDTLDIINDKIALAIKGVTNG